MESFLGSGPGVWTLTRALPVRLPAGRNSDRDGALTPVRDPTVVRDAGRLTVDGPSGES